MWVLWRPAEPMFLWIRSIHRAELNICWRIQEQEISLWSISIRILWNFMTEMWSVWTVCQMRLRILNFLQSLFLRNRRTLPIWSIPQAPQESQRVLWLSTEICWTWSNISHWAEILHRMTLWQSLRASVSMRQWSICLHLLPQEQSCIFYRRVSVRTPLP